MSSLFCYGIIAVGAITLRLSCEMNEVQPKIACVIGRLFEPAHKLYASERWSTKSHAKARAAETEE